MWMSLERLGLPRLDTWPFNECTAGTVRGARDRTARHRHGGRELHRACSLKSLSGNRVWSIFAEASPTSEPHRPCLTRAAMTSLLRSALRALQGVAATEGRTVGAQGRIDRAAGSLLARPFSNSAPSAAAAKGKSAAKKPQVKKKAVLRKNAPSGPRSTSVRRKTDGASQSTSSLSKGSPFLREASDSLTQADEVSLRQLDTTELGSIVKLPESFVKIASGTELSQLRGNGVSVERSRTPFRIGSAHIPGLAF